MRLKDWREVVFDDWPRICNITKRTIERMVKYAERYLVDDMRLATGRVKIDTEYEAWRERTLSRPLP